MVQKYLLIMKETWEQEIRENFKKIMDSSDQSVILSSTKTIDKYQNEIRKIIKVCDHTNGEGVLIIGHIGSQCNNVCLICGEKIEKDSLPCENCNSECNYFPCINKQQRVNSSLG